MEPTETHDLLIASFGIGELDGDLGLQVENVGAFNRGRELKDQFGMLAAEPDQRRCHPEGAQALGHRYPNAAARRGGRMLHHPVDAQEMLFDRPRRLD